MLFLTSQTCIIVLQLFAAVRHYAKTTRNWWFSFIFLYYDQAYVFSLNINIYLEEPFRAYLLAIKASFFFKNRNWLSPQVFCGPPGCWKTAWRKQCTASSLPLSTLPVQTRGIKAGPPVDLSFWSFLTFLHHGIEEVERHLLWKFHKKFKGKVGQMCHRSCSLA